MEGNVSIREMKMEDFEEVYALWMQIHGFGIRSIDDSKEGVERFIRRNPTTSMVAVLDGKIIGAFAVCLYSDGGIQYDTMSIEDLENTRKQSKASNSPAWKNFTGEMYKKTVLHRLCKHIELDFENPTQRSTFMDGMEIETDQQKVAESEISANANSVDFPEDDVIDADATDVVADDEDVEV